VLCSFFATLMSLGCLIFAHGKLAPATAPDWGKYNVFGFDSFWGPVYGVPGTPMRYFVGVCELLGGLVTLACVWCDDPRAYFLSVGAMIGLGTIFAGALLTRSFYNLPCNKLTPAQSGPAIFALFLYWGVAARRYSLVPGAEEAITGAYYGCDLKQIVQIFAGVCASGLVLAALLHCAIGQKTFSQELIAMDDHFFANGNKWSANSEVPDGFGDVQLELLEGEYDEEEDAE
jgi:hypothetical protein